MLKLILPKVENWDSKKQEFVYDQEVTLELEHSLVTLSKWESKWEKPFLGPEIKSTEETIDYIRCMTLTPDVPPETYHRLSSTHFTQVNSYIDSKMSATWFNEAAGAGKASRSREIITAEIIYYWLDEFKINWEAQHWHLNRLFTLVKVHNQKNVPEKKMSRRDMLSERNRLNAQRKTEMKSQG